MNKLYVTLGFIVLIVIIILLTSYNAEHYTSKGEKKQNNNNGKANKHSSKNKNKEHFNNNEDSHTENTDNSDNNAYRAPRWTRTHNTAPEGTYAVSNYKDGRRGNSNNQDFDNFMSASNDLLENTNEGVENFSVDKNNYLVHDGEEPNRQNEKLSDIFNSDSLLPNQNDGNDQWFDLPPEPISVKNKHLIMISQPGIGTNTVGTSRKNAGHDIRGTPPCPKFVVAPWMQSSIEPDTNIKSLC